MRSPKPVTAAGIACLLLALLNAQTLADARIRPGFSSPLGFPQTKVAPKIVAIRAQLFYDATGTFSQDILSQKDLALWNTIIGEGSAGAASTSTFVTIEITGWNMAVGATKVEITATGNKSRLIQKRLIGVDIYDERTKFVAPFWLYDTGCEPIKIAARLIGAGAPRSVVTKTIPFACGE
ncbi:MAG TPA: hypothetical protein VGP81_09090 [Pyrinomonadaceae bacterium]|jgi:hypothetical protein|nr:hypothetical protein [Pyrinomonadaceae bacterium]